MKLARGPRTQRKSSSTEGLAEKYHFLKAAPRAPLTFRFCVQRQQALRVPRHHVRATQRPRLSRPSRPGRAWLSRASPPREVQVSSQVSSQREAGPASRLNARAARSSQARASSRSRAGARTPSSSAVARPRPVTGKPSASAGACTVSSSSPNKL